MQELVKKEDKDKRGGAKDAGGTTLSTPKAASPTAYLLPGFDEYLLGYKDRSAMLGPTHATKIAPGGNGIFKPIIVIDGRVVGTWKRTFKKDRVAIAIQPFNALSEAEARAVAAAAERYGAFVNLPVALLKTCQIQFSC